jgi:DHA1 family bicyclomycin/chloramphenicol resistance-like MFS transporter
MNTLLPRRPNGVLLAAIACSGTLAMHIFVPVLPAVAHDFAVTPGAAQMTLTVYLIGLAVGQLIYGPLSDRFGRRPVLITALLIFLAATVLAGFAPSLKWLIAARVVQALGACGGLVLGRAMARDGATPEQAARQLALLIMVMTVAPAIAPLIGGTIAVWLGWRSIFGLLGAAGTVILMLTITTLPETNRTRVALPNLGAMLAVYGQLLRRREFCAYATGGACMSTSIYAFLSASPFLFVNVLHRPPAEVGLYYMVLFVGITLGSWLASRLALRFRIEQLLRLGALFGMLGAAGLLAGDLTGRLAVFWVVVPMALFTIGAGLTSPLATSRAIGVNLRAIGSASALYGFLQMSFGAICTLLAGLWHGHSAAPVACILLAAATTAQIAFALVGAPRTVRQGGELAAPSASIATSRGREAESTLTGRIAITADERGVCFDPKASDRFVPQPRSMTR